MKKILAKQKQTAPTLEDFMGQGVTRFLDGKEVTLGYTDWQMRIGWVWKDTGLPANKENKK